MDKELQDILEQRIKARDVLAGAIYALRLERTKLSESIAQTEARIYDLNQQIKALEQPGLHDLNRTIAALEAAVMA